jgi:DNA invertase Pin-like site-specific DNA recombinase
VADFTSETVADLDRNRWPISCRKLWPVWIGIGGRFASEYAVNTVQELADRGIGFKVIAGQGVEIDTTTASGKLVFGIFAALAEFERELIRERTKAGLAAARSRGRKGGRKFELTKAQIRLAQAAMGNRDTKVSDLCEELSITRTTLYRYVGPKGELRANGKRVLGV